MAYDVESDRVMLFGGETAPGSNVLNDETWAYDLNSNSWENRNPSPRPSARFAHAMAYDADSDRIILFGGWTGAGQSLETWAYDYNANTWTNMTSGPSPPAGVFVAMAYDVASDRMILFGGVTHRSDLPTSGYSGETWAYDFDSPAPSRNTWRQMNPDDSPRPRAIFPTMAYDIDSDRIVLFGGRDAYQNFGDTWEYSDNEDNWTETTSATGPTARHAAAMSYEVRTDRVFLFGGYTASGISNETWAYNADNDTWTGKAAGAGPTARFGAAMVDDTESDRLVLTGGSSRGGETWTLAAEPDAPPTEGVSPVLLGVLAGGVILLAAVAVVAYALRRRRRQEEG